MGSRPDAGGRRIEARPFRSGHPRDTRIPSIVVRGWRSDNTFRDPHDVYGAPILVL